MKYLIDTEDYRDSTLFFIFQQKRMDFFME